MKPDNFPAVQTVIHDIEGLLQSEKFLFVEENSFEFHERLEALLYEQTQDLIEDIQRRVRAEFLGLGPLEDILEDREITEILLQKDHPISYEKGGRLYQAEERFFGRHSFERIFQHLLENAGMELTTEKPFGNGRWKDFRLHAAIPPVTSFTNMTLRRLGHLSLSLDEFERRHTLTGKQLDFLRRLITERQNILLVGPTGCGKTSLLNSCLHQVAADQRVVILEDTDELQTPNPLSLKLLTRTQCADRDQPVDLTELVRQSLRMRPDRLVMGEVRGAEAKDLLMALATGHAGSFCTMHADSAQQALIRLEMLVQLGAPQWGLDAVRKLIALSLQYVAVMGRVGRQRQLLGIYRISGVESFGFLLDQAA